MKLVKIGALMLSLGLSQTVFAETDVSIGIGRGGASVCIGERCPDRRGDRWDRGDRRDRDHRGDGWGRRRVTECFARNARGITFSSRGFGPEFRIQREAVRECRYSRQTRNPATCRPVGCRTNRW